MIQIHVSNTTLRYLAAVAWYTGCAVLLVKGGRLLQEAQTLQPDSIGVLLSGAAGTAIGYVKAVTLFKKSCKKNLLRITGLNRPFVWQFFRPRFFIFLFFMIVLGATLSRAAQGNFLFLLIVATVDLSVGVALLISSSVFWKMK